MAEAAADGEGDAVVEEVGVGLGESDADPGCEGDCRGALSVGDFGRVTFGGLTFGGLTFGGTTYSKHSARQ